MRELLTYARHVSKVHHLSRTDARRLAVRAQLLTRDRPTDLVEMVRHLTLLQVDPISAVAPSADLVCWSRLGSSYSPEDLRGALEEQRLVDHLGKVRPIEDMALYRADMAAWPGDGPLTDWQVDNVAWVEANGGCRHDILELLRAEGPLTVRELPDTCEVPWRSTGWTNHKNVPKLLDFMVVRGEVAVVGRRGRERLWDLASRVYPDEPFPPVEQGETLRRQRRLRSLGIVRARRSKSAEEPWDASGIGEEGVAAVVDGLPGEWRVDPALLDEPFRGRAALLSPLDRLVHDRTRMAEIFDFDYQLEMYKPKAKRRWGYYALPILYGDRLVGKLDATAERKEGVLRVDAVHEDAPFSRTARAAVDREIEDLAGWLGLEVIRT